MRGLVFSACVIYLFLSFLSRFSNGVLADKDPKPLPLSPSFLTSLPCLFPYIIAMPLFLHHCHASFLTSLPCLFSYIMPCLFSCIIAMPLFLHHCHASFLTSLPCDWRMLGSDVIRCNIIHLFIVSRSPPRSASWQR